VLVYVIYVISIYIMNSDNLATDSAWTQALPQRTTILTGVVDASSPLLRSYNTVLPSGSKLPYINIRRSVNRLGGAQFSYSFWMYVDNMAWIHQNNASTCNLKDGDSGQFKSDSSTNLNPNLYTLFIKGDKRCYQYTTQRVDKDTNQPIGTAGPVYNQGRYVMSPMVAIGNPTKKELFVYFNTLDKVNNFVLLNRNPSTDSTKRHNVPSLVEKAWTMYTFVFMDYMPISDFERGIVVKSYVNDTLYQMDRFSGTLRDNEGEFTVLPDGKPGSDSSYTSKLMLSSMDYYNYALSDKDVIARFNRSVNQEPNHDVAPDNVNNILSLSAYNKLDIYNL
jgi:hypothetical protein